LTVKSLVAKFLEGMDLARGIEIQLLGSSGAIRCFSSQSHNENVVDQIHQEDGVAVVNFGLKERVKVGGAGPQLALAGFPNPSVVEIETDGINLQVLKGSIQIEGNLSHTPAYIGTNHNGKLMVVTNHRGFIRDLGWMPTEVPSNVSRIKLDDYLANPIAR
jgi:hypothetical protein